MGGGGTAGAVAFPQYIEETHQIFLYGSVGLPTAPLLDTDIAAVMDSMLTVNAGNPFSGFAFTDPATTLDVTQDRLDAWDALVGGLQEPIPELTAIAEAATSLATTYMMKRLSVHGERHDAIRVAEDITQFFTDYQSGLSPAGDWEDFIDAVVAKLAGVGVLPVTDIEALVTDALNNAELLFAATVAAALDAVNDPAIPALVTAFTTRLETAKGKSQRDFTSGMADANATHGSAFIMGLALIESDFITEIARYQAELESRIYQSALQAFAQMHGGILNTFEQITNSAARAREQLLSDSVRVVTQMLTSKTEDRRAVGQLFMSSFLGEFAERIRGNSLNAQLQTATTQKAMDQMVDLLYKRLDMNRMVVQQQTEANRIKVVATSEYEQSELELDKEHSLWDIGVFEKGANLLAAPSGMAAALPPRQSRMQSALGGAATGAGVGMMIGGPAGAGIGAAIGGLAGLFG